MEKPTIGQKIALVRSNSNLRQLTTQELKKLLVERISQINDPDIINHLYRHLELEMDLKGEATYILTKEEEQALDEAENDVIKGRILTDEDAKHHIRKWIHSSLDRKSS